MHSPLLPEAKCNEIEKICRRFIRGEKEGKERPPSQVENSVQVEAGWVFIPPNFITLSSFYSSQFHSSKSHQRCFVYIPYDLHCSACAWFLRIFKDGLGFDFADQSSMALKIEIEIPRTGLDKKTKIQVPR